MQGRADQKARYARRAELVRKANDSRDAALQDIRDRTTAERRAVWEASTHARCLRNNEKRRARQLEQGERQSLDERRRRLADMLNVEFAAWEREIEDRVPTVDDFKADMRRRALALRAEREEDRLALVQQKLEEQQRMSLDDVRTLDSQRVAREVAEKRAKQFDERREREAAERREAEEAHRAVLRLQKQKDRRHRDDVRKIRERNAETKDILDQQLFLYRAAREKEQADLRAEADQLSQMWAEEQRLALEREREERLRQQAERVRVQAFNKSKFDERAKAAAREREIDLKLLSSELERQRREIQAEEDAKTKFREENRRYRELLAQQMIKEKEDMSVVDKAINDYNDKVQKKREDELAAREAAREALMQEVMASREEELRIKARRAEEQRVIDVELTRKKQAEDEYKESLEVEKEEKRRQANVDHRLYLQAQMHQKQRKLQRERQEVYLEHRAMVRTEQQYAEQLEKLKNRPVQRNFGLKTANQSVF